MKTTALKVAIVLLVLFTASCATNNGSAAADKQATEKSEAAAPDTTTTDKNAVQQEEKQEEPSNSSQEKEFVLDKDTYIKTKEDLSKLVETLNGIIERRDYNTWLSYLSKEYYDYYSSPEVLKEQSESPLLKKYGIVLRSLKDYFNYVVVGSRKNVRLDEIKALDKNHIKAYMYVDGTPVIIYELVKINGEWKITLFDDMVNK